MLNLLPPPCNSNASKAIRLLLSFTLLVASLPAPNARIVAAQSVNQTDKPVQSRKEPPHKNLPSLSDVLDEGKGIKAKAKAKDTPPQPSTLCRYRDLDCQEKKRKAGQQIGSNTPAPEPRTDAKADGNWLQRIGKKLTGAFSGTSASLSRSAIGGNSFLPATTAAAAPPPPPTFSSINQAKLDPHNRIGTGSEDLFSGNFHWSTPLISLPGRNGLDVNLTLHYNSLQWVRFNSTMYYDPDWYATLPTGLTTGFNLGFPALESGYTYDGVTSYLVTLPSGYRVPMQRVYFSGSTAKYQAADGSNLYLVLQGPTAPLLYMPDGTQYTYGATSGLTGGKRCTQVKDRNGNRITIAYNGLGISSITDTLGRVLNFVYDGNNHLSQITQSWLGQTHVWAQFDYSSLTLDYNFSVTTIDGPADGAPISVLTKVTLSDGARYTLEYNGWGVVKAIYLRGATEQRRAAVEYVFPTQDIPLQDGPRFSQRNDGIWGFTGQWNDDADLGWVANYFDFDPNETFGRIRTPDGVVHKELFSASSNTRGLPTGMETWVGQSNWTGGMKQKWSATMWDNSGTNQPVHPRVTETNIYDNTDTDPDPENQRRTKVEYWTFTAGGTMPYTVYLPKWVDEYGANAMTVYRRSETAYLNDANYWTRWIVGLPTAQRLYAGTSMLQAQTTYGYDEAQADSHPSAIMQHDTANYGAGFYTRGNRTTTTRYSVADGQAGSSTETHAYYYVTGNVATLGDALNHYTDFFYTDSYATYANDANNTETVYNPATKNYAYPTRIEDPDNYSSHLKYWYDTGAVTRTTDPKGAAAINLYDTTFGRLTKAKNLVNSAYTRYDYDTAHNWVQSLTTVNSTSEETVTLRLLDGAGRERMTVNDHPGSAGGLSASYRVFDFMGRVIEWSNPTEIYGQTGCGQVINGTQQPACWATYGDDATNGYVYSRQDYDWNHRPTVTYNQDYHPTNNPNSKRMISYDGCGCAGSVTTTFTDEMGRVKKAYSDFLGRTDKTEIMDGANVYSSVQHSFNVRDQILNTTEYAGAVGSGGAWQQTLRTYDGYGRLATSRKPIETGDNTYQYNADDTLSSMTDARGAITTYSYNARHLATSIGYTVGSSGATTTSNVTFQYNELGQRTEMNDGPGVVNYYYDQLGRMTSEVRTFDLAGAPTTPFTITYGEYNLIGQVKKIKDPFNDEVNYSYDKTGRLATIIGATSFAGIADFPYLSSISYRAWGGVKNARTYDARMRVTNFSGYFGVNYQYDLSSKLISAAQSGSEPYHQSFSYDHAGRLTGVSTPEINAPQPYHWTQSSPPNGLPPTYKIRPFTASLSYDEFSNLTGRDNAYWHDSTVSTQPHQTFQTTYENGRAKKDNVTGRVTNNNVNQTWLYNAAGEITYDTTTSQQYDVVGRLTRTQDVNNANIFTTHTFDGDGRQVKFYQQKPDGTTETRYRVYSSVTGRLLTEIDAAGQKLETHIYSLNGQHRQVKAYSIYLSGSNTYLNYPETVVVEFTDPHGTRSRQWERQTNTYRDTHISPVGVSVEAINWQVLKDRFVQGIAAQISYGQAQAVYYPYLRDIVEDPTLPGRGCMLDGQKVSCAKVIREFNRGWAGFTLDQLREFERHPSTAPGLIVSRGGVEGNSADEIVTGSEVIDLNDLSVDLDGGGDNMTPGQRKHCDRLAEKIKKWVDGFDVINKYGKPYWVKGLTQRLEEQVGSTNGPGTDFWEGHRSKINEYRDTIRDLLKAWDKSNCGPPPPGVKELLEKSTNAKAEEEWNRRQNPKRESLKPPVAPVVIPIRPQVPIPLWQRVVPLPLIIVPNVLMQFLRRPNQFDDSTE